MLIDPEKKRKHIDDLDLMYRRHGLYDTKFPFEFKNENHKRIFYRDFNRLGHTHVYSKQCICCKEE